ncbi:uncharacterized protein LOC110203546 [Phascolarctos cinereus]
MEHLGSITQRASQNMHKQQIGNYEEDPVRDSIKEMYDQKKRIMGEDNLWMVVNSEDAEIPRTSLCGFLPSSPKDTLHVNLPAVTQNVLKVSISCKGATTKDGPFRRRQEDSSDIVFGSQIKVHISSLQVESWKGEKVGDIEITNEQIINENVEILLRLWTNRELEFKQEELKLKKLSLEVNQRYREDLEVIRMKTEDLLNKTKQYSTTFEENMETKKVEKTAKEKLSAPDHSHSMPGSKKEQQQQEQEAIIVEAEAEAEAEEEEEEEERRRRRRRERD